MNQRAAVLMDREHGLGYAFLSRCMECRRGLAMRILSVCLFVRLSVKRVICDKMEERSVQILSPSSRFYFYPKPMHPAARSLCDS